MFDIKIRFSIEFCIQMHSLILKQNRFQQILRPYTNYIAGFTVGAPVVKILISWMENVLYLTLVLIVPLHPTLLTNWFLTLVASHCWFEIQVSLLVLGQGTRCVPVAHLTILGTLIQRNTLLDTPLRHPTTAALVMKDSLPLFGIYPTNSTCVPSLAKVAFFVVTRDKCIPLHVA